MDLDPFLQKVSSVNNVNNIILAHFWTPKVACPLRTVHQRELAVQWFGMGVPSNTRGLSAGHGPLSQRRTTSICRTRHLVRHWKFSATMEE